MTLKNYGKFLESLCTCTGEPHVLAAVVQRYCSSLEVVAMLRVSVDIGNRAVLAAKNAGHLRMLSVLLIVAALALAYRGSSACLIMFCVGGLTEFFRSRTIAEAYRLAQCITHITWVAANRTLDEAIARGAADPCEGYQDS